MDEKGLPKGCGARKGGWLCTRHSLDGKMHLAFGGGILCCDPWPITDPKPVRVEVIEINGPLYPEWPDA